MNKMKAIVIGATGAAGQNIVEFIQEHPWFELTCLAASHRSHGLAYKKAIEGAVFFGRIPKDEVLDMKVQNVELTNQKTTTLHSPPYHQMSPKSKKQYSPNIYRS